MATLQDIGVSALINLFGAFLFLIAFAVLRIQPINDRVYFPKWYLTGDRSSPRRTDGTIVGKFVNLNFKTYFTFLNWMPQAMKMSESEIIRHAGFDSAIFLRIYTLGLRIFAPAMVLALGVLVPVNVSSGTLFFLKKELVVSNIDKLSISNVQPKSSKFFFHIGVEYLFTFWACFMLYREYNNVANMRLHYLATQRRRPEQFTVVVRNVPDIPGHSVPDTVDQFFKTNHPEHYLCHQAVYNANKYAKLVKQREKLQRWFDYYVLKYQRNSHKKPFCRTGFLGLWGQMVDSIEYYKQQIKEFDHSMSLERQKVLKDSKLMLPVTFVSFDSRWGAAVCAQTQQSKNPTLWLTSSAPEPRDIYWENLAIPFISLTIRKLVIGVSVFFLVFFYMIPIAFVQSLANLEGLERVAPFLRPVIRLDFIKSFLQGFLPGLALKIFLWILPTVLLIMSKIEGYIALSTLERRAAAKYYYFMLVNVFLGSIIAGTAFEQLDSFLHQSPTQIPRTIGVSIPMKATFFITFIMVDGWAGIAGEILRIKPLVIFHLKNMFLVKTEQDRERAMDPGFVDFKETIPSLQLYFLLGIVYAVVTPILLPFILVFFAFAYLVYRHQIINVYNQQYESCGAFWPHVHGRIIASLLISQLLLMGLLASKEAADSTPLLIILPILTLSFHKYCKHRFEPAFRQYPLEDAMAKDKAEKETEPELNMKADLADAYLHPIFHSFEKEVESSSSSSEEEKHQEETPEVRVDKHETQSSTPVTELGSPSHHHYAYNSTSPSHYTTAYEQSSSHYATAYEQSSSQYEYNYETQRYEEHEYRYN
ncbi:CSC1-like protein [Cardamine amara subsp. amara]|uniref:CSC1-like protein n=1 Tax=Cardamine amara subsp. amara TaxID=228776 RepID=A0ABD1B5S5_CARAN